MDGAGSPASEKASLMKRIRRELVGITRAARRRRTDLGALLFLGGAVALFFWPIWVKGYRFPMGGGDLWGQLHPTWSYVAEWLRRGIFPLWSTRIMGGDPIIAEPQTGLLNPMNWMLFLHHPIPPWLVSLRALLPLWLAGAGLYLYLRHSRVWSLHAAPALIGAVAYMFSDPFIAHLGHPHFNDTLAWLPWILLGLESTVRRKAGIIPTALAVAALILAGHGQAAIYAACLIAGYALWQAVAVDFPLRGRPPQRTGRALARLALAAGLGAAIAAPALLPALERLPHTDRAIISPNLGEYEFHPGMWRDFISPLFHGRNMRTFWAPWERVETGYIGFAALGLAVLGIVTGPWSRRLFLAIVASVSVLFALGTQGPIYPLVANLPLFNATWKTGRAIFLLSFALAMAAAAGSQALLTMPRGFWRKAPVIAVATGLAALILFRAPTWAAAAPNPLAAARAQYGLTVAAVMLVAAAALGGPAGLYPVGRAGLVLVVLGELVIAGAWADVELAPRIANDPHADAVAYFRDDAGWFRVDVDGGARGLWSPAAVMAAGFEVPQGTGNPMELVAYNQYYWGIPHKGMPAYHLLGAKYVIVPKDAQPGGEGIWPVYTENPLVDIHLNTRALPRVWLTYTTVPVGSLEAAYALVFEPDFEPWNTATVKDGPALSGSGSGTIEVLAYGPNRAAFRVDTTETALLVVSDLLYPGWRARIDRRPAPIYATNGLFRGIVVPPGAHTVEMLFRPTSLRVGMGVMGMALSVMVLLHKQAGLLGPQNEITGTRTRG